LAIVETTGNAGIIHQQMQLLVIPYDLGHQITYFLQGAEVTMIKTRRPGTGIEGLSD